MIELLVLAAIALALVGPFLSIVALARTRGLDELRRTVASLEEQLADLKRRARAETQPRPPAAAPAPSPAPQPAPPPPPQPPSAAQPSAAPRPPASPPAARPSPPPAPPRPAPPEPETPPKPPVDWERWIGIRGAAVLGGIVLALAGLLFFQYSIQHGLITPVMRVVLGIGVGISAIVASEWLRPRGYHSTPEGLAGAGVVLLYAALWAGHALYHLIPMLVCFSLMILVTVAAGLLAVRRESQLVAVLGLVGGFATPLLLRSGSDRPVGLFGYILLLDLGLLAVGRRRRWPWLSLLGLAGTVLLQALWIGVRMGPERLVLGLLILGVFAVLFGVSGFLGRDADRGTSRLAQAGGLLVPFVFALYFAARVDLGPHLWPVAILLAMLAAGASWVGKRQGTPALALAASAGSLGVFAVWQARISSTAPSTWESVAIAFGLALIFHVFVELDPDPPGMEGPAAAAIVAAGGFLAILVLASARAPESGPWIWLAGWLALSALLYRHAAFPDRAYLQFLSAVGVAAGLSLQLPFHAIEPAFPAIGVFLGAAVAVAAAAHAVALARRDAVVTGVADHAAAVLALIFAFSLPSSGALESLGPALALGAALVLGVLVLLAGTRSATGAWSLGAIAATTLVQASWVGGRPDLAGNPGEARAALGLVLGGAALFVAWPFAAGRKLQSDRLAWIAAALAGPVAFLPAKRLWLTAVGPGSIGLLPLVLAAFALLAVAGARRTPGPDDATRKSALVWFAAVAICFASVAIPLQLHKSWITIGWALEGLALIALWRRLDHPGLKWFALAHLAAVTVRLVPTLALLGSYPRSSTRIVNWLLYTYLIPAAALFASSRLLAPDEPGRARPWESGVYASGKPVGAIAAATAGIVVVFVWINLAIADWFAEGTRLTLQFGHSPARDLTVSIAWALYALVLLGFGMARENIGLRWLSLSFLVVTIGKVFLYDLGELHDLYRVVSLVGLAVSLLLVSLLYQRFVFRRPSQEKS
jgi:uncharacterized membrane protein